MENTTQDTPPQMPHMSKETAEAWGIFMHKAEPTLDKILTAIHNSGEQERKAATPIAIIAGVIALGATVAAIMAIDRGNEQLAKEILLPLITFAGGLSIGAKK